MAAETTQPTSSIATTIVLALWAGVVGGMLVAALGFADPRPLHNAGLYLATLGLTTTALIATFTSPRGLVSRGTQLGVTLSLILHTGLTLALAQMELQLADLNAAGAAVRDNMTPPAPPTWELVDVHQSEPRPTPLFEKPVESESLVRSKAIRERELAPISLEQLQANQQLPTPNEPSLNVSLSKPRPTTPAALRQPPSLATMPQPSPVSSPTDIAEVLNAQQTPSAAANPARARQAADLRSTAMPPELMAKRERPLPAASINAPLLASKQVRLPGTSVAATPETDTSQRSAYEASTDSRLLPKRQKVRPEQIAQERLQPRLATPSAEPAPGDMAITPVLTTPRRQHTREGRRSRNAANEQLASAAYQALAPSAASRRPETSQTERGTRPLPQLRASTKRLRVASRQSSSLLRARQNPDRLLPTQAIDQTNEAATAAEDRFSRDAALAERTAIAGSMTIDTGLPSTAAEAGRARGARPAPASLAATTALPLPARPSTTSKAGVSTQRLVPVPASRSAGTQRPPAKSQAAVRSGGAASSLPSSQSLADGGTMLRPIDITQKNPLRRPQRYATRGALSAGSVSPNLPLSSGLSAAQQAESPTPDKQPAKAFAQREKRPLEQGQRSPAPGSGESTPLTEAAIERGLAYLNQQQQADGSWTFSNEPTESAEVELAMPSFRADAGATGLALLSFLGAGYDHFGTDAPGRYRTTVQRGLDYLVRQQAASGELYPEASDEEAWQVARFYSHGIASLALCEAYGMTGDPALREPAQKALNYLKRTQVSNLGGWRYTPGVNADLSVTGWQVMALRSGQLAGLRVSPETLSRAEYFVELCRERSGRRVRFCYNPKASADDPRTQHGRKPGTVMTSVGLLLKMYLGANRKSAQMQLGADHLLENLPKLGDDDTPARTSTLDNPLRDTYYWYYATQVMFHMGGDYWQAWNEALHPMLVATQVNGTDLHGSWNPMTPTPDKWSRFGGRHYVTTMNLLSLEVYYRHLPLYENE